MPHHHTLLPSWSFSPHLSFHYHAKCSMLSLCDEVESHVIAESNDMSTVHLPKLKPPPFGTIFHITWGPEPYYPHPTKPSCIVCGDLHIFWYTPRWIQQGGTENWWPENSFWLGHQHFFKKIQKQIKCKTSLISIYQNLFPVPSLHLYHFVSILGFQYTTSIWSPTPPFYRRKKLLLQLGLCLFHLITTQVHDPQEAIQVMNHNDTVGKRVQLLRNICKIDIKIH